MPFNTVYRQCILERRRRGGPLEVRTDWIPEACAIEDALLKVSGVWFNGWKVKRVGAAVRNSVPAETVS